jgi:DNA-binding MarR family transcriptional regulator
MQEPVDVQPSPRRAAAAPLGGAFVIEPALNSLAEDGVRSRGITYVRLRLLSALRFGGPRRMLDLGGELGVTARNVTGLVDALQRDGLVERLPHPNDRRAVLVRLTPAGSGYLRAAGRAARRPRGAVGRAP